MLKIQDFKHCSEEWTMCWCHYKRDDRDFEAVLSFRFDPLKDDAWYQIAVGECLEDNYKEIEVVRFNRLKEAITHWNNYFGEDEYVLHFSE